MNLDSVKYTANSYLSAVFTAQGIKTAIGRNGFTSADVNPRHDHMPSGECCEHMIRLSRAIDQ
jgi:hypothetical protein